MDITVPQLGESVTEATVAKWFKSIGDAVVRDEPLVELETDKVTLEVNAAEAGTLAEIAAADSVAGHASVGINGNENLPDTGSPVVRRSQRHRLAGSDIGNFHGIVRFSNFPARRACHP